MEIQKNPSNGRRGTIEKLCSANKVPFIDRSQPKLYHGWITPMEWEVCSFRKIPLISGKIKPKRYIVSQVKCSSNLIEYNHLLHIVSLLFWVESVVFQKNPSKCNRDTAEKVQFSSCKVLYITDGSERNFSHCRPSSVSVNCGGTENFLEWQTRYGRERTLFSEYCSFHYWPIVTRRIPIIRLAL